MNDRDFGTIEAVNIPKFVKNLTFGTENQSKYYNKIVDKNNNLVLCHAVAGVGKTHISIWAGLQQLYLKQSPIKKLIIINPTVDVGSEDKLGFLPGSLDAKISNHNESAYNIIVKIIGEQRLQELIDKKKLEFRVLNFLRGANLEDAFIIMDEAQNTSPKQLKTLMTRISDNSKLIIQGDLSQCDKYKDYRDSGFHDIWKRLKGVNGIDYVEFSPDDVIRSTIVKRILERYWEQDRIILNGFDM